MAKKLKDYLYYSEGKVKLYNADCFELMKKLPNNYVDLIVTDPPYGYSFMGKDWDKVVIPVSHWKECLRILKPGAFAFVMSAPRQDVLSRMILNLQEAGFETGFSSIYYSYATGFPKASNISKKIDKQECKKQLTKKLERKPTKKEFDEEWKEYRKITGKGYAGAGMNKIKGFGVTTTKGGKATTEWDITEPKSLQAKTLEGSYGGFQPKPAVEIIIVAMKPLNSKTYVDQALKNGHGITWLDNCRVPHSEPLKETNRKKDMGQSWNSKNCGLRSNPTNIASASPKGRFPANLLVSDDTLNDGKISKSGQNCIRKQEGMFVEHKLGGKGQRQITHNDSGSFSRYFDLDAWWTERIKKLPRNVRKVFPFLITPKASKSEKNRGLVEKGTGSNTYNRKCLNCGKWERKQGLTDNYTCHCVKPNWEKPKGNLHPTVKPIKLMSYLITLGSRGGDIVLDPFLGSGTTGIAAKLLGRKFIGIEMNKDYCKIAKARIKGW